MAVMGSMCLVWSLGGHRSVCLVWSLCGHRSVFGMITKWL